MSQPQPLGHYFLDGLWRNNQVLVAILGICSALAVTTSLNVSITMGLAVSFVTGFSCLFVSMLRKVTPDSVRMIAQLAIISLFVIVVDQFLQAYFYSISKKLSVFVSLIITNCIVMGRTESMAKNVPPIPAFLDGIGAGLGYGIILLIVGFFRELLGFGTLFGIPIVPSSWYATTDEPNLYQNSGLAVLAPSAFVMLGIMVWMAKKITRKV